MFSFLPKCAPKCSQLHLVLQFPAVHIQCAEFNCGRRLVCIPINALGCDQGGTGCAICLCDNVRTAPSARQWYKSISCSLNVISETRMSRIIFTYIYIYIYIYICAKKSSCVPALSWCMYPIESLSVQYYMFCVDFFLIASRLGQDKGIRKHKKCVCVCVCVWSHGITDIFSLGNTKLKLQSEA